eukprot:ctg_923.g404
MSHGLVYGNNRHLQPEYPPQRVAKRCSTGRARALAGISCPRGRKCHGDASALSRRWAADRREGAERLRGTRQQLRVDKRPIGEGAGVGLGILRHLFGGKHLGADVFDAVAGARSDALLGGRRAARTVPAAGTTWELCGVCGSDADASADAPPGSAANWMCCAVSLWATGELAKPHRSVLEQKRPPVSLEHTLAAVQCSPSLRTLPVLAKSTTRSHGRGRRARSVGAVGRPRREHTCRGGVGGVERCLLSRQGRTHAADGLARRARHVAHTGGRVPHHHRRCRQAQLPPQGGASDVPGTARGDSRLCRRLAATERRLSAAGRPHRPVQREQLPLAGGRPGYHVERGRFGGAWYRGSRAGASVHPGAQRSGGVGGGHARRVGQVAEERRGAAQRGASRSFRGGVVAWRQHSTVIGGGAAGHGVDRRRDRQCRRQRPARRIWGHTAGRSGRYGHAAVHLGHYRPAQGGHAHPPQPVTSGVLVFVLADALAVATHSGRAARRLCVQPRRHHGLQQVAALQRGLDAPQAAYVGGRAAPLREHPQRGEGAGGQGNTRTPYADRLFPVHQHAVRVVAATARRRAV